MSKDKVSWKQDHLRQQIKKVNNRNLNMLETVVTNRLAQCKRFYPWPALEQSFAADLEAVWAEQAARRSPKSPESLK